MSNEWKPSPCPICKDPMLVVEGYGDARFAYHEWPNRMKCPLYTNRDDGGIPQKEWEGRTKT